MASPSDRPAPRFGPRVRTYEEQITAEFEDEIAELYGKLYERDMEIERLRSVLGEVLAAASNGVALVDENDDRVVTEIGWMHEAYAAIRRAARAASRDEERDHA